MAKVTSWSVDPSAFGDLIGEDLAKRRTTIALDAHKNIVLRTPVRTGHARRNWVMTYTHEFSGTVGKTGGPVIGESGSAAITAQAIASGYQALAPKAKHPFEKVIISNNVPYVPFLEHGTRKMKAFAMVALTMVGINAKYAR